jgi:anionic cell wall polymer biosynthesis LytR-Cps2A-Psr (LCP) family protein
MEQDNSNTREIGQKPAFYSKKDILLSRFKRKLLKHVWLIRISLLVLLIGLIFFGGLGFGKFSKILTVKNYSYLVSDFIFTPKSKIASFEGRVNILLLGKSGEGHIAPDLTDTIIFASVPILSAQAANKSTLVLISIPRDIWIPQIRAKLNSAYFWGRPKDEGGGLILTKSIVEEIIGKPVHYGVVFDFSAFTKIIDVLGGIEIDVVRSFIDNKYPIPGKENDLCDGEAQSASSSKEYKCRYETIKFEKGKQTMDGEVALKFVRSRNAEGEEGTDLAREARQQKVIVTVKKKLLSFATFLSPKRIFGIWKVLSSSVESDADLSAVAILARKILSFRKSMTTQVIPEDFLINPPISVQYDNQYVFIPKVDGWTEVREWVDNLLK